MKRTTKRRHVRRRAETTAERDKRELVQTLKRELRVERRIQRLTRELRGAIARSDRARLDLLYDIAQRDGLSVTTLDEADLAARLAAEDELTRPAEIKVDTIAANG